MPDRNDKKILEQTGFEICKFPPNKDPCECCGKYYLQLYFQGSPDDGRYWCMDCVRKKYLANVEVE